MDDKTQKIYDQTLRFLSFRPRATYEIKAFLRKHHATNEQIDGIVNKLESLSLINDEAFVRWWIEQRQTFRQKGLRVIKLELRQKGIPQEIIEKVIEEKKVTTELDLARKAAQKKLPRYKNLSRNDFYTKMGRYLASRGFDWEVVKTVIDEMINKE